MGAKKCKCNYCIGRDPSLPQLDTCPTCKEHIYPGQRFFAAPIKKHVMCQKYEEEFFLACQLMHKVYTLTGKTR